MGVLAMLIAAFAPRLLGLRLGQPFGERRGLTLAGTFLVVEAFLEVGDALAELLDELVDEFFEFGNPPIAFDASRAQGPLFLHAGKLLTGGPCSCAKTHLCAVFSR